MEMDSVKCFHLRNSASIGLKSGQIICSSSLIKNHVGLVESVTCGEISNYWLVIQESQLGGSIVEI